MRVEDIELVREIGDELRRIENDVRAIKFNLNPEKGGNTGGVTTAVKAVAVILYAEDDERRSMRIDDNSVLKTRVLAHLLEERIALKEALIKKLETL